MLATVLLTLPRPLRVWGWDGHWGIWQVPADPPGSSWGALPAMALEATLAHLRSRPVPAQAGATTDANERAKRTAAISILGASLHLPPTKIVPKCSVFRTKKLEPAAANNLSSINSFMSVHRGHKRLWWPRGAVNSQSTSVSGKSSRQKAMWRTHTRYNSACV